MTPVIFKGGGRNHTHIMMEMLALINKLTDKQLKKENFNDSIDFSSSNYSEITFFKFIIHRENVDKIIEINRALNSNFKFIQWIGQVFNYEFFSVFSVREKILLFAILIFKSVYRLFRNTIRIKGVNSHLAINSLFELYSQLIIYYCSIELNSEEETKFKKMIFGIFSYLSEFDVNIISTHKIWCEDKTVVEYSLNLKDATGIAHEDMHISNKPFSIISVNNTKYLKADFFAKTFQIFNKNLRSDHRFELKDWSYLELLCQTGVFINHDDLKRILNTIEKYEKIQFDNIENDIKLLEDENTDMRKKITSQKFERQKIFRQQIWDTRVVEFKNKYAAFTSENLILFLKNKFIDFCKFYTKKNINIQNILDKLFLDFEQKNIIEEQRKLNQVFSNLQKFNKEISDSFLDEIEDLNYFYDNYYFERNCTAASKNKLSSEIVSLLDLLFFSKRKTIIEFIKLENDSDTYSPDSHFCKFFDNCFINFSSIEVRYKLRVIFTKLASPTEFYSYYSSESIETKICELKLKTIQKRLSKLWLLSNIVVLSRIQISEKTKIYFAFAFDFRGRLYYHSKLGPTNLKYSRYIYNYGLYPSNIKNSFVNEFFQKMITRHNRFISEIEHRFQIQNDSFAYKSVIFWCLIGLGKITVDKSKVKLSTTELLDAGLNLALEPKNAENLYDQIEKLHYVNILKSLKEDNIHKRFILKDATASFLQNLIRIVGPKDEIALQYANLLNKDEWCDSYSYVLEKWKTKNITLKPEISRYFIRKTTKKTIMTNPYSAVFLTAFNYFRTAVEEVFNKKINIGDEIYVEFQNFYKFVENELEVNLFLKTRSNRILKHLTTNLLKNKEIIIESHDARTNLIYYKMKQKSWDLIITIKHKNLKKRKIKKFEEIDKLTIDVRKIEQSLRANIVHYADALLVRDINKNFNYCFLTVHDCFMIDMFNVNDFIWIANQCINNNVFENIVFYQKEDNIKYFSPYIFI